MRSLSLVFESVLSLRSSVRHSVVSCAATVVLCACSGSNPNAFPDPGPKEAGPVIEGPEAGDLIDGPNLFPEAGATAICLPQSVGGYKPAWVPPEAWKQGACSSPQIAGFYSACLTPPISETACQAFAQANSSCSTCLQSPDTAAEYAAVIWHENKAYWTVNVAGCIARAMGDPSGSGCGASYSAAIACRQQSCGACWAAQGSTATFPEFASCEEQAGQSTCSSFTAQVPATCGNLSQSAGSVCMPASAATAQEAYMQIAPLFCGK
jgi:hypothetical protein